MGGGGDRQPVARRVEADATYGGGDGREADVEGLEAGGIEPQVVDALFEHAGRHGLADHVPRRELVDEPLTLGVAEEGAMSPQGLGEQGPGHRRVVQSGRVELHELDVGDERPGPQGHGQAVTGGLDGVGGHREQLAGAAGGQNRVGGPHLDQAAVRRAGR